MIKRLYVDNYRCLVNFHLELQEMTLLVGPNGSGKSSVLEVLLALRRLLSGTGKVAEPDIFPAWSLTRWQDRDLQVFEIVVSQEGEGDATYRLEIEHRLESQHRLMGQRERRPEISLESLKVDDKPLFEFRRGEVRLYQDDHTLGSQYRAYTSESALARVAPAPTNRRLMRFLDFMRGVSVCALDPKHFQADSTGEESTLQPDGGNFVSWYRHQIQERPDLLLELLESLREILQDFYSIRLEKVGSETRAFMAEFKSGIKPYSLRLDELSDGQRELIALYSLIYLSGEQDVLFLDEPDNFLALAEIQPWLMALSDTCGTRPRQAILCSHHPELIDYLGGESGILLKRESTGSITTRRLSEIPLDAGLKLSEIIARGWES